MDWKVRISKTENPKRRGATRNKAAEQTNAQTTGEEGQRRRGPCDIASEGGEERNEGTASRKVCPQISRG